MSKSQFQVVRLPQFRLQKVEKLTRWLAIKKQPEAPLDVSKDSALQGESVVKGISGAKGTIAYQGAWQDIALVVLPLCAFVLWWLSLSSVHIRAMNDLGLVSVMPPTMIAGLAVLTISFCLALQRSTLRVPIIMLHVGLLIFMLFGITALVEDAPRFSTVYTHAGYTEYIMRKGKVAPDLDTYFSWPFFFILSAFFTKVAGYRDVLAYAAWASVFFNLLYLGPLYLIFTCVTMNRRLIWLSIWLFFLTNWIWQDYFSPQGMNFFLYLVILAILLKWFKIPGRARVQAGEQHAPPANAWVRGKVWLRDWLAAQDTIMTPSQPWQRGWLLVIVIAIFSFDVASHPLTPFFVVTSVAALVIFRRCYPFWLPILMGLMTAAWILFMAQSFLVGHAAMVIGSFGLLGSTLTMNVSDRVIGSQGHLVISKMRLVMTGLVWGLAVLSGWRRERAGYKDLSFILLAIVPFPLLAAQDYGGEMLLRIYLFALPFVIFFVAALFYAPLPRLSGRWMTLALIVLNLVLLGGFLFTRYGNERNDYISKAELDGVRYLYSVAPPDALLMKSWDGGPWHFQDYEQYDVASLVSDDLSSYAENADAQGVLQFVQQEGKAHAYMVFMSSERATFDSSSGYPPGRLQLLEHRLLATGKAKLIYRNPDIDVLMFVQGPKEVSRETI